MIVHGSTTRSCSCWPQHRSVSGPVQDTSFAGTEPKASSTSADGASPTDPAAAVGRSPRIPGAVGCGRYRVDMTATGHSHPIPAIPPLPEGSGPSAIRAALVVEEREEFDEGYRRALAEAAETLELACVLDTLEHWRRRAIMSADPQAYRRMLTRAAQLLSGEDVPKDEPLAQLKKRLARFGV